MFSMPKVTRRFFVVSAIGVFFIGLPRPCRADRAEASIEGPREVSKGEEVVLKVTFSHSSNTPSHYVEWAYVRVNGKEVARWDFTPEKLPESARFTREVRGKIEGDTEITAQGSCNKHGSKGQATLRIRAK